MSNLLERLPPVEEASNLEPDELGSYLLPFLQESMREERTKKVNRYNIINAAFIRIEDRPHRETMIMRLAEGWAWLLSEGLIAPDPLENNPDWCVITRKGERFLAEDSARRLVAYKRAHLLPRGHLEAKMELAVRPIFSRGDYDTAVFRAFKEVEVKVREASGLPTEMIGVNLVTEAFRPGTGPLTDKDLPLAEQEAMLSLFRGSIGLYKNPSSHRDVDFEQPIQAAEAILIANHLLRIVEKRASHKRPDQAKENHED